MDVLQEKCESHNRLDAYVEGEGIVAERKNVQGLRRYDLQ